MAQTQLKMTFDDSGFDKFDKRVRKALEVEMQNIADRLAQEGSEVARFALNEAVTDYGESRMIIPDGSSAGRNHSGKMLSSLRALKPRKTDKGIVARVGWYFANEYFKYQESGTGVWRRESKTYDPDWDYEAAYSRVRGAARKGGIVGAHSLWTAGKYMQQRAVALQREAIQKIEQRFRK